MELTPEKKTSFTSWIWGGVITALVVLVIVFNYVGDEISESPIWEFLTEHWIIIIVLCTTIGILYWLISYKSTGMSSYFANLSWKIILIALGVIIVGTFIIIFIANRHSEVDGGTNFGNGNWGGTTTTDASMDGEVKTQTYTAPVGEKSQVINTLDGYDVHINPTGHVMVYPSCGEPYEDAPGMAHTKGCTNQTYSFQIESLDGYPVKVIVNQYPQDINN